MKNFFGNRLYTTLLSFVVLCIVIPDLSAESLQRVVVREYIPDVKNPTLNASKHPLPNVEVNVKGAGSTVTDADGTCVLRFNLLNGGDRIVVRQIARPGYEVLNPELLNDLVIRRDDKPLEVVMISQENAIKLSRIISQQVGEQVDKMRLRELDELDILAVDYDTKRKAIISKYEARLDDIDQYIDRLVRVDITRVSANESAAFKAFSEGNLEMALQIFDNENLIQQYRETISSLNAVQSAHAKVDEEKDAQLQSQKDIQYFLKTQITMLEMEGSEESLLKAKSLLEQLLDIDPFGEYQAKEYLSIILAMKQFDYAKPTLNKLLADYTISPERRCRLAINLGAILYAEKKYDEVILLLEPFEDEMNRMVYSEEPLAIYLPLLGQQILGHCEQLCGNREEATHHYRIMFDLYRKLRQVDAITKFYANVTYPRLIKAVRNLQETEEWQLADSILSTATARVEELYSGETPRERLLWCKYRMGQAVSLIHQNQLDEGMHIMFDILPEIDAIFQKNQPLCSEFYQHLLLKITGYYADTHRYADVIKYANKWFEINGIPYDETMQPPHQQEFSEDELVDYRNICFMYQAALDQTPQNP